MFKNLRIRNFRAFDELEVERLGRVNLIAGKNNSGKTSLLEALFLLCWAGNPHVALNTNVVRGSDMAEGSAVPDTLWKPMFTNFDMSRTIEIEGRHESFGPLSLNVALDRPDTIQLPFDSPGRALHTEFASESALGFSFKKGSEKSVTGRIRLTSGGFQIDQPVPRPPFNAVFLSSRTGNLQEDAKRLGRFRQRKQGELVVNALRTVEPRLGSVEDNSASGVPMIWGDIGLSELVPLPMMGEGMTRIARLILAISEAQGGVVLVDEVENGLHHSALGKVWGAISAAARQFDTQIVASTHSHECLEAAHDSLDEDDLLIHRLETIDETIRCITLEPEVIKATVEHNFEIR